MLPKAHRIIHTKDILSTLRSRFQSRTKFFYLKLAPSEANFKLLVIVSKKISKRSYIRNRLRRRIHAIFELMMQSGSLPSNIKLIVQVSNKSLITSSKEELEKDLLDGVSKLYFSYVNKSTRTSRRHH